MNIKNRTSISANKDYSEWEQVEEDFIIQSVILMGKDSPNIQKILNAAEIIKFAGLTPVYMYHPGNSLLTVYADELVGKVLN